MAVQPHDTTPSNIGLLVREPKLWGILLVAFVLRLGVIAFYSDNLTDDRDAYLSLSQQLAEGNGFRVSADAPLTAYRPPLYPLILSVPLRVLPGWVSVAVVNLVCSLLIVSLVWILARESWNQLWSTLATGIVVCDPLLLINATLPMTELLFTTLVLAVIVLSVRPRFTFTHRIALGILFGLAALCRPTIWAFGVIAGIVWCFRQWRESSGATFLQDILKRALPVAICTLLMVSPWVIRNYFVFDAFIPMTTHGGYTLLLANNEVFYEDVVERGWRTTWSGESLESWQHVLEDRMNDHTPALTSEVARSQWMGDRARDTIRKHPRLFLKSCGVRFFRFWNPVPISTSSRPIPRIAQWGIGVFSTVLLLGVVISLIVKKSRQKLSSSFLVISASLLISLSLVHTVYWSNARMRAPIEPLLAMLAVSSISKKSSVESKKE
jgi:hypothetical protein